MVKQLMAIGCDDEFDHHEAGGAGQAEIDMRFATLLKSADNMMKYKYIVRNVAYQFGKSVTFMPKPLFGDNGSGMHTHQSLWAKGQPRSEEHTSELQSRLHLVCRLLLEKKKNNVLGITQTLE